MALEEWGCLQSAFGAVAAVARGERLSRIIFEDSVDKLRSALNEYFPHAIESSSELISSSIKQLEEYFRGERFHFDLALDNSDMSPCAKNIQNALLDVPFGSTITYGELASKAGRSGASRAVGTVMSTNPFPLIVPCHRVVNKNGTFGRYSAAAGAVTKLQLINFEQKHSG